MLDHLAGTILEEIGRRSGQRFEPPKRTQAGESASTFVVAAGDEKLILKVEPAARAEAHRRGAQACEHLRRFGYPAPRTVETGVLSDHAYTLRTWLPGHPMAPDDGRHIERLIDLGNLHADGARTLKMATDDWPNSVVDPVLLGGAGYCLLETMRVHSQESADLLSVLQDLVGTNRAALPEATDIIHYDFNPANILVGPRGVTGVVDWEGVRAGDRTFDLVTLLFYTYDSDHARTRLWAELVGLRPRSVIAVYFAHIILRQVEWSLRLHPPALGRRYLDRAHVVLRDLARDDP